MISRIKPKGDVVIEHIRNGEVLGTLRCHNDVTTEGLNELLKTMFSNESAANAEWYIGLITGSSIALAAGDTMSSHSGWTEITAGELTESVRQTWLASDTVSAKTITNATAVTFTIESACTVRGMFLSSSSTLGGTAGKLWATAEFDSAISAVGGDLIKVTYTIAAGV